MGTGGTVLSGATDLKLARPGLLPFDPGAAAHALPVQYKALCLRCLPSPLGQRTLGDRKLRPPPFGVN